MFVGTDVGAGVFVALWGGVKVGAGVGTAVGVGKEVGIAARAVRISSGIGMCPIGRGRVPGGLSGEQASMVTISKGIRNKYGVILFTLTILSFPRNISFRA